MVAIEAGVFVPSLLTKSGRKLWAHLSRALWRIQIPPTALIIELDGNQHGAPQEERNDGLRTAYLNQQGYRVLRFWNEQVNADLEGVLQAIYAALTDS